MFKVIGQAYYAHHAGRATLAQVEALVAGMAGRMAPIEERLGPVPFPEPEPAQPPPPPPAEGQPGLTGWGS